MNLTLFSLLVSCGTAHILMKKPPSDKYMNRTDIPEAQKDSSLRNPMTEDRINNPCGSVEKIVSSGSYAAGTNLDVELDGVATHEGGQCQFGYTYDRQNFAVTHIEYGDCVEKTLNYSIPIPATAPNGPVTFFWSWFNRKGNREMYMNCGEITIANGTGSYISGKKLLVTNILPTDIKFPESFSYYFGKDLFEAMPDVKAKPSDRKNTSQSNPENHDFPSKESNSSKGSYQQQSNTSYQGHYQPNIQKKPANSHKGVQNLTNLHLGS